MKSLDSLCPSLCGTGRNVLARLALVAVATTIPGCSCQSEVSKIAFTGNGNIFVMNTNGSEVEQLTDSPTPDERPTWSPDRTKIAFRRVRGGPRFAGSIGEIYVMNADGSEQTNLSSNPAIARGYLLSDMVKSDDLQPAWSPDGTKIAFVRTYGIQPSINREIYIMNADGSEQTRFTNNSADDFQPIWSPDGAKIAFVSDRAGNYEIYVMSAEGGLRLTYRPGTDGQPAWSPDGTQIAFTSERDRNLEIYVMNPDGTGQTNLTRSGGTDWEPAWSPDGTKIAFRSGRSGRLEIYVMNADGGNVRRLTKDTAPNGFLSWTPDGKKIVFVKVLGKRVIFDNVTSGHPEIYIMNANGTGVKRLTNRLFGLDVRVDYERYPRGHTGPSRMFFRQ